MRNFLMGLLFGGFIIVFSTSSAMVVNKPINFEDTQEDIVVEDIVQALSGELVFDGSVSDGDIGENIRGQFQLFTSNGSADTEDTIAHDLGFIPQGFFVTKLDKGAVVYDSGTTWTTTNIFVKTSLASTAVELFLF